MRERIENKDIAKAVRAQLPVIPTGILKERGCTFCPYYAGPYEKQPRCMMAECAWDNEEERFHPSLRQMLPEFQEKMERAKEKYETCRERYELLTEMFAAEMEEEKRKADECYGCCYGRSGPCIGICYRMLTK